MTYKERNVMANFKKNRFLLSPLWQALGAAFLMSGSAAAQQADTVTTLPPVVIIERSPQPSADVAGLGDTPLARTPVSAAVIDARQIDGSGARRLADLMKFDASVSDAYNAVGYWDYATVRGYVLDNQFNYRREGLPINAETFIPLDNKEQVEILKGTSGMQAGTSAPGGLVNYTVKRPTDAPLHSVRMETNSTGDTLLGMDLGDRFGANKEFGYRLNAVGESLNSVAINTRGSRQLLALALDWRISRDTLLQVEGEYSRRSQPSVPGLSLLGTNLPAPDPKININSQPWSQPVVLEGATGTVKLEQRLNSDWRWIAQLGTQRLTSDDRAAFPFGCSSGTTPVYDRYCANGDFDLYDFSSNGEHRNTDAAQLQIKGRIGTGSVQHQVGAAWLNSSTRDRFALGAYNWVGIENMYNLQTLPSDLTLSAQGANRTEHSNELSTYDDIAWTPRLSTWLGLRHTRLERSSLYPDGTQATSYAQSLTTPWAALTYQLTPEHMLYASWGKGVESQIVPNRPDQYTNPGQALNAITSRQSEFGIKAQDHDLRWQLSYFSIVRPATNLDACANLAISSCTGAYDGNDDHRGLEASAQWRGGPWSLLASATLMHARREGSVVDPSINGQVPTNVPDNILRAQADYRVPAIPGLTVQARLSHEGTRSVLPDGSVMLPAWNQLDSTLRYDTMLRGTPTTWTLGVDNLTDRRFFKESPNQYGHAYLFPAAPRLLRISVQASL
jgi:iron complex outermembrane receptor protein